MNRTGQPIASTFASWAARNLSLCAGLTLGFLVLAAYWPMLEHDFVNYDDNVYVTGNPRVRLGLTWPNLVWSFTTTEAEFWHPLTWLSHMADCEFYGVSPVGHHLTSLLLHLANTLLLFFVLKRLTLALSRSLVVAALFGLHPLHVESVAWVAERKDLLSAFFFFLAVWAYARFAEQSKVEGQKSETRSQRPNDSRFTFHVSRITHHASRYYFLSLFFFACGLMSKPMLVTLPFLLLLLDYWPLRRPGLNTEHWKLNTLWPLVREKGWFFLLAFAGSALAYSVQHSRGNLGRLAEFPLGLRLANALVSYVRYLGKTFWPSDLAVFYPYPHDWPMASVAGAALVLVGISAVTIWLIQRRPYLAVGWFWFLGTLVPVIGLVQVAHHSLADRYTYLPLIGLFLMLVWLIAELMPRWGARALLLASLAVAALGACLAGTHLQLRHWQNSEVLSRHALRVTRGNYVAHNNLANVLQTSGKLDQALVHYTAALQLKTNFAAAHSNLGLLLASQGQTNEAAAHFLAAIRSEPRSATAHYLLAGLLDQQGNAPEAFAHYLEALRLRPDFPEACNELGCLLAAQAKWSEAGQFFLHAVQLNPDYAEAHNNLGSVKLNVGNLDEAANEFALALALQPGYADAQCNLGKALYYRHQGTAAANHFMAALKAKPDWIEALDLLARILAASPHPQTRNGKEALRLATRAVELTRTNDARTLDTLAAAYAEIGRYPEAVTVARRAADTATAAGQMALAGEIQARTKLYEADCPFRE